jgi:hypothetical protein
MPASASVCDCVLLLQDLESLDVKLAMDIKHQATTVEMSQSASLVLAVVVVVAAIANPLSLPR